MKPAPKQLRLLERFRQHGVPLPTTRQACSTLIGFLFYGEHSQQDSCSARLALFRKWTNATVKVTRSGHPYRGHLGKVTGWRMLPKQEIAAIIEARGGRINPLPFMALVTLDCVEHPVAFSLSDLKLVCRAEQKLLFSL